MTAALSDSPPAALSDFPPAAQQIILAAEHLVAERGLDGTSMREILRRAGQGNNSAIYRYFGAKDELIRAIYDLRQAQVDAKRRERILALGAPAPGDAAAVLCLLLLPVVETFEGAQRGIFARFILHLMLADLDSPLFDASRQPATTHELNLRLRACFPGLPDDLFRFRYSACVSLFLHGLIQRERMVEAHRSGYATDAGIWDELVQSALAVMSQPFPPLRHARWRVAADAVPGEPPAQPAAAGAPGGRRVRSA